MADKLSWTELRRTLAKRAGVSEKEANAFLSAFNSQIIAALKQDKQVKVNGLGTFRLQAVAPRKSVNVTTGEAITIEGYNKIAFMPEAGVKELIEHNPVAQKSAVAPTEDEATPLKKLGEQASEIVNILADLGQAPKEEKPKKRTAKKIEVAPVVPEVPEVPIVPEVKEEVPIAEPEKPVEAPVAKQEKPVEVPVAEPKINPEPKKKYHFFRDTLICVILLLALLICGYFFFRSQLAGWIESLLNGKEALTEWIQKPSESPEATPIVAIDTTQNETIVPVEEASGKEEDVQETPAIEQTHDSAESLLYEELITIEPMHEASRLTWMAKRYYGSKDYWPYLYDANRDRIGNPNAIKVGTPIRVPKLTVEQMDTTIEKSRKQLLELKRAAEAACRQ